MWRNFLVNEQTIEESGFKIKFPKTSLVAFINFDALKTDFSSFYKINNTPALCDFVCLSLTQTKCEFIEVKNLGKYIDIQKGMEKLKRKLPKKFVDTLLILVSIVDEKEKRLLFKALWDKGIVYYLMVSEEKTPYVVKAIEFLERKISECLKVCGIKVRVFFRNCRRNTRKNY